MLAKLSILSLPFAVACSGGSSQVLTGHASPSLAGSVTTVVAKHRATVVASAPIASDGSFRIAVPPSRDITLVLVGNGGRTDVVFPRHAGTIQRGITILGGGAPFELGMIRLAPSGTTFSFHDTTESECSDGTDGTGATCVDDSNDDAQSCEADTESESEAQADDDNGAEADASSTETDDGDSTADHNFPSSGCSGGGGSGSGSGSGAP
jgi:hypothetical protein